MEKNFDQICLEIKKLPYKRNKNKTNILCVLEEGGGTCSTKHAYLKYMADKLQIADARLMLGIFKMNAQNTPKTASVLEKYKISEMPEAHNYLRINGKIMDCTNEKSGEEDFIHDLIEEKEININQIVDFKINYHKEILQKYLQQNPHINYSLGEFWKIREECIAALQ